MLDSTHPGGAVGALPP